jgi:hypothetical protein
MRKIWYVESDGSDESGASRASVKLIAPEEEREFFILTLYWEGTLDSSPSRWEETWFRPFDYFENGELSDRSPDPALIDALLTEAFRGAREAGYGEVKPKPTHYQFRAELAGKESRLGVELVAQRVKGGVEATLYLKWNGSTDDPDDVGRGSPIEWIEVWKYWIDWLYVFRERIAGRCPDPKLALKPLDDVLAQARAAGLHS